MWSLNTGYTVHCFMSLSTFFQSWIPRDSVVKCLTHNPGVQGSSRTGSSGFFSQECPWARHFRAQPSTGETRKDVNNVSCRRDMTEILLKAV